MFLNQRQQRLILVDQSISLRKINLLQDWNKILI